MLVRDAHLNMVESSRRLFEFDPGAELEVGPGWLFGAGRSPHPTISNAAFRTDDGLDPGELLERARAFFAARGRGFALWARGVGADEGLIEAAERAGLEAIYSMPEMVLRTRPQPHPPPPGVELRRVATAEDAAAFWGVAEASYTSIGFPPEVFSYYEDDAGFRAEGAAAFIALLDGEPAAIAMTLVSHGIAGIYWVGSTKRARGLGLGTAVTAAAIEAGLEMGPEIASLQASPMGESLYRRMGFETLYACRLLSAPEPR